MAKKSAKEINRLLLEAGIVNHKVRTILLCICKVLTGGDESFYLEASPGLRPVTGAWKVDTSVHGKQPLDDFAGQAKRAAVILENLLNTVKPERVAWVAPEAPNDRVPVKGLGGDEYHPRSRDLMAYGEMVSFMMHAWFRPAEAKGALDHIVEAQGNGVLVDSVGLLGLLDHREMKYYVPKVRSTIRADPDIFVFPEWKEGYGSSDRVVLKGSNNACVRDPGKGNFWKWAQRAALLGGALISGYVLFKATSRH